MKTKKTQSGRGDCASARVLVDGPVETCYYEGWWAMARPKSRRRTIAVPILRVETGHFGLFIVV